MPRNKSESHDRLDLEARNCRRESNSWPIAMTQPDVRITREE